jgi:predicted house-cleaning noncanonical NTP pyrophosphatase (MazG superfamily)
MGQKEKITKLLHRLAEMVEHSSMEELEALLEGRASLVVSTRRVERGDGEPKKRRPRSGKDLAKLGVQIRQLESRDAGSNLLLRAHLTKKELEELARLMDLPVLREDDSERLRQKIVEASIGARLNSQAIRGEY